MEGFLTASPEIANLVGVGNPLRGDDAVGLETVSLLRRTVGARPRPGLRIYPPSPAPEAVLSRVALRHERLLIIDAVEAGRRPGTVVCVPLERTKFGFFATHDLPLKLIPGMSENFRRTYVLGVQPGSVGVGEGLSPTVAASRDRLVATISGLTGGTA